jgi:hypothetical protein
MPNEERLPNQQDEELLGEANCVDAKRVDPNGPPVPVKSSNSIEKTIVAVGCVTIGGILFSTCGVFEGRTMGATRSAQLKWEERDRQIEEAFQKDQQDNADVQSSSSICRKAADE